MFVCILMYLCPYTAVYVCLHTAIYVSSYCYMCVKRGSRGSFHRPSLCVYIQCGVRDTRVICVRCSELEIVQILTKPNTATYVCSVVLAIRGSFEFADVLTDLVAAAVEVLCMLITN